MKNAHSNINSEPTNEEFLKAIFGADYLKAHVCGFPEDPATLDEQNKNHLWAGGPYSKQHRRLKPGNNTFFAVSTFSADPEGRQRRRKHLHEATYCVVIDDVREKVDPAQLDDLLPTWAISTSAGSEQWGYLLATPETNPARVEALLNGLVAAGITEDGKDPGMKGVTRYVRLPVGSNTKAKRYVDGEPFSHVLKAWEPERRYSLEQIAEHFGIDLDAVTETGAAFTPGDWAEDPLPGALAAMGLLKSKLGAGRYDITCPWQHEHSDRADTGSAVLTGPDGQLAYKCHHGHCHNRYWPDFQGHVMDELDRARSEGDEVLERPLAELLRRVALAAGWEDLGPLDPFEDAESWEPGEVRSHAAELAELKRTAPERFNELREVWDRSEIYSGKALDKLVQRKRLYCVDFASIEIGNEPPALVENWLGQGRMSVVYGSSNVGKSFFVLDLALHIALGREWRGNQVERGAVVYVAAESGESMGKRVVAFREHHGIGRQPIPFALVPCPVNLLDEKADIDALVDLIQEAAQRLGATPALVVVDTLARALAGGDENSGKDMNAIVDNVGAIQANTGAHVLIVHHTGKDKAKGARGHSSLRAAVDTEIEIDETKVARCTKQRDMEGGREIPFQLDPVEVGFNSRGAPITSCVVVEPHIRPGEVIFEDDPRFKELTGKFLEAAVALRFRWESEQPGRITFDTFKEWMVAAGVRKREEPRQQFHKLKDRLRRAKIIAWTDPHIRYLSGESGN